MVKQAAATSWNSSDRCHLNEFFAFPKPNNWHKPSHGAQSSSHGGCKPLWWTTIPTRLLTVIQRTLVILSQIILERKEFAYGHTCAPLIHTKFLILLPKNVNIDIYICFAFAQPPMLYHPYLLRLSPIFQCTRICQSDDFCTTLLWSPGNTFNPCRSFRACLVFHITRSLSYCYCDCLIVHTTKPRALRWYVFHKVCPKAWYSQPHHSPAPFPLCPADTPRGSAGLWFGPHQLPTEGPREARSQFESVEQMCFKKHPFCCWFAQSEIESDFSKIFSSVKISKDFLKDCLSFLRSSSNDQLRLRKHILHCQG